MCGGVPIGGKRPLQSPDPVYSRHMKSAGTVTLITLGAWLAVLLACRFLSTLMGVP